MRNLLNFLLKYNYLVLFVLLQVICLVLLAHFNNYQASVFFTSANRISGSVYEVASQVTQYFGLEAKNKALTARNTLLELEIDRLRKSLKTYTKDSTGYREMERTVLSDYQLIEGNVVNNEVTHADNYVTINRGKADGVKEEMGVITGTGVVGIVYLTSEHYAIVLPVLNSKSSISCKINRTKYFGALKWDGVSPQFAYIKDLPRHAEFSLGDTIVTSGHSEVFPEGIPVGTVDDMTDSKDGLSYMLKVKLFADFARLDDIAVIKRMRMAEQTQLEDSLQTIIKN